jgi:exosortase H (IPTLxxWG-CTERM-specific)
MPLRRLELRFILTLALFAGAVLVGFRDEVVGPALLPLRVLTARVALALIHVAGMEAVREATAIFHPSGFAYQISRGCMGLVPAAFFAVSVIAYPISVSRKALAMVVGLPVLFALNMVRLVHLFYLGVHRPDLFHLAHQVLWQGGIIAVVFLMWLLATRGRFNTRHSTPDARHPSSPLTWTSGVGCRMSSVESNRG